MGRGACLQVGDLANSNDYINNTVTGFGFASNPVYNGVNITNTVVTGGISTITTSTAHNFRRGDMVTIMFTDNSAYWGDAIVTDCGSGSTSAACTSSSTTFRYNSGATNISAQATPGVVALAYVAVLDNAENTRLIDISSSATGADGFFNNFFDLWDDENATIEHFNNNANSLTHTSTWTGSFVFSGGSANIGHQLAPVITLRDSTITANYSNGVTDYNSNGLYIENTVPASDGSVAGIFIELHRKLSGSLP